MKQSLEERLPEIKKDVLLAPLTTLEIGGKAKWFLEAENSQQILKAVVFCRQNNLPFFILGSGSNLLVSDEIFEGLVIKIKSNKIEVNGNEVIADSGVRLADLLKKTVELGLSGLEFVAGIPGTLGGAAYGNIGVQEKWIGNLIEKVEVLDQEGRINFIDNKDCGFSYRSSSFPKNGDIILRVFLNLKKSDSLTVKKKFQQFLLKRGVQPQGKSAGSIFKNPPGYNAGQLIERCGLKGKRIGQAQISFKHANWIINLGGAKAQDVLELIRTAKSEVKKKLGIDLEPEIKFLNLNL